MSGLKKFFKDLSIFGKLSITILLIVVLLGIFGPIICKHPHNLPSGPPFEPPSLDHPFGTDDLGMDLFAQIIYGARISLTIALFSSVLTGILSTFLGIMAAYYGGIIDIIIMRISDILIIFPTLPLAILLGVFFGPAFKNIVIVLVLLSWSRPARSIRSKIISVKEEKAVVNARVLGAKFPYLLKNYFIPASLPITLVTVIRIISRAIVMEASLSFLGLSDPTSKSWGLILSKAISYPGIYFLEFWKWWVIAPLVSIIVLVVSAGLLSMELEERFTR